MSHQLNWVICGAQATRGGKKLGLTIGAVLKNGDSDAQIAQALAKKLHVSAEQVTRVATGKCGTEAGRIKWYTVQAPTSGEAITKANNTFVPRVI